MTEWFGESWGAPICSDQDRVPTPVGSACGQCSERIEAADQGVIVPHVGHDDRCAVRAFHLDCWLDSILPHGPDCEFCRGLWRAEHKLSCAHAKHGGRCDCPRGADMQRLLDPTTTLAQLDNIAERTGKTRERLEAIARRGFARRNRRRPAAHNPVDDAREHSTPKTPDDRDQ